MHSLELSVCLFVAIWLTLNSFFFNDTATTEIYPLSLHDALPISTSSRRGRGWSRDCTCPPGRPCRRSRDRRWSRTRWPRSLRCATPCSTARRRRKSRGPASRGGRSEEHTSELQSQSNLVCRLLLE